MGLFDKKYCDVCGDKIGLLGNRKLDDGNLCKNCAAKLSPFFSERRHSTVAQIKEQLAYREANLEDVKAFHVTRTMGRGMKVLVDENAGTFMVTRARNLEEANPDVIKLSQVTGCRIDVDEDRDEQYTKDKDGKRVSYNPPQYEYSYDFYIVINVNHPYFDEIRFQLNDHAISNGPRSINDHTPQRPAGQPIGRPAGGIGGIMAGVGAAILNSVPARNAEYDAMMQEAEELKAILLQTSESLREEREAANAPKIKVTCPVCGATTLPDANGCCEFCGSPVK